MPTIIYEQKQKKSGGIIETDKRIFELPNSIKIRKEKSNHAQSIIANYDASLGVYTDYKTISITPEEYLKTHLSPEDFLKIFTSAYKKVEDTPSNQSFFNK